METSIRSARHYAQFAAGAVTVSQIQALSPEQTEGHATGLEVLGGGTVTIREVKDGGTGVLRTLGPLPAGWVRAVQFTEITASDTIVIVYRSTSEGSK
jgi:hypothetical protein